MSAVARHNSSEEHRAAHPHGRDDLVPHGRGSNWIHQDLGVIKTGSYGLGVVALAPIAAGTSIVVFGGIVITSEEFEGLSYEMQNFPFQVADDLFLAPRNEDDLGIGERINHSCVPNTGFSGAITIVTLKDIQVGEEVTFDYATCVASNDDAFVMACACGAPSCRKNITGHDWRIPELQTRLFRHFQPFLQEKILSEKEVDTPSLKGGKRLSRLVASNSDTSSSLKESKRGILAKGVSFFKAIGTFISSAIRQEWMAIPVCIVAGLPSTIATMAIMTSLSPVIRDLPFIQSEAAFISIFSLLTSVVGYATYLIAYYSGMLWKERAQWIIDGRVSSGELRRKFRVIQYDFIAHLPSDLWVMPLIGVAQGGLVVSGVSQGWSILLAHTLADIAYAIKEPFFWYGAKQLVAWQDQRKAQETPSTY